MNYRFKHVLAPTAAVHTGILSLLKQINTILVHMTINVENAFSFIPIKKSSHLLGIEALLPCVIKQSETGPSAHPSGHYIDSLCQ